ncbi:MAG: bifunctional folylpolyglutamate synthase/dihydrofolate synthase [Chloroflexi bacterium]|nr:bifunctional folylpolyglutamate synthase/dihydrofolate synthase [Chloroflexota bacterium]
MTYEDAIEYLLTFADFERSGRFQDRPDVAPMLALLRELGDPHLGRVTVHIAGSKGKGSVAAMVESCLRAAGHGTGLYTSPHLHSYCERIRVDGQPISETQFAALVEAVQPAVERLTEQLGERRLVTFDLLTAMAFLAFRQREVDVQVLEVGLGGRVDSTNVFETKDLAVITPLSLEHTAILGDDIESIAREKAAIITPQCTIVMAPQTDPGAGRTVRDAVKAASARLIDVAGQYRWRVLDHDLRGQTLRIERSEGAVEVWLPLIGGHQAENAATAVACIDALRGSRDTALSGTDEDIARGLSAVQWHGRMEVLREHPLVIADGAHNGESARRLVEALREYVRVDRATFIVACLGDKDVAALAAEIAPMAERVFATQTAHPRAMNPSQIVASFRGSGVPTDTCDSVKSAVDKAIDVTQPDGVICLLGSLSVAAAGREYLLRVGVRARG